MLLWCCVRGRGLKGSHAAANSATLSPASACGLQRDGTRNSLQAACACQRQGRHVGRPRRDKQQINTAPTRSGAHTPHEEMKPIPRMSTHTVFMYVYIDVHVAFSPSLYLFPPLSIYPTYRAPPHTYTSNWAQDMMVCAGGATATIATPRNVMRLLAAMTPAGGRRATRGTPSSRRPRRIARARTKLSCPAASGGARCSCPQSPTKCLRPTPSPTSRWRRWRRR